MSWDCYIAAQHSRLLYFVFQGPIHDKFQIFAPYLLCFHAITDSAYIHLCIFLKKACQIFFEKSWEKVSTRINFNNVACFSLVKSLQNWPILFTYLLIPKLSAWSLYKTSFIFHFYNNASLCIYWAMILQKSKENTYWKKNQVHFKENCFLLRGCFVGGSLKWIYIFI